MSKACEEGNAGSETPMVATAMVRCDVVVVWCERRGFVVGDAEVE